MPKQLFAGLIAAGALLLAAAPAAFAAEPAATVQGARTIDNDSPTGYYLWHSEDGFHLRTHGPGARHDFDAVLRTRGTFENVDVVKLEDGDHVDVLDGGHELAIHFHTYDFTDGVNFTVRGGDKVRLDLKLDDKVAPTYQIFIGANAHQPMNNPFTIEI
ncbi:MAG: hypothetical protein M3069_13160 [Chloroflexota bacterium]|nr:hypothetical protein [Chloroflexota bacterium]